MGCSLSKEIESPSKRPRELRSAAMPRASAVVDENLKPAASSHGYIAAAILSANYSYSSFSRLGQVQKTSTTSGLPVHSLGQKLDTGITAVGGPNLNAGRSPSGNVPKGEGEALETINMWELMQGLEDDVNDCNDNDDDHKQDGKIDGACREEAVSSLKASVATGAQLGQYWNRQAAKDCQHSVELKEVPDISVPQRTFSAISMESNTTARKSNTDLGNHFNNGKYSQAPSCVMVGNFVDNELASIDGPLKFNDLQRALSFKYILGNNETQSASRNTSDADTVFFQTRLMLEGDGGASYVSSPEFSASLKDWIPDQQPTQPTMAETGSFVSTVNSVQSKDVESGCDESVLEKGTDKEPVFDPNLLESFENVVQRLSKDEWNAVQGMEESPYSSLRLVNSFRRSNTAESSRMIARGDPESANTNTAAKHAHTTIRSKPVSSELNQYKKHSEGEKKPFLRRQRSWEPNKLSMNVGTRWEAEMGSKVVFYSSGSDGDTKILDDCNAVRAILSSLIGPSFDERMVSENSCHEEELKALLGSPNVVLPTIVVKGKQLVGVDSILQLYQRGILSLLVKAAMPQIDSNVKSPCVCRGGKLLVCPLCKGRRKVMQHDNVALVCRHCGGTGLIKCSSC